MYINMYIRLVTKPRITCASYTEKTDKLNFYGVSTKMNIIVKLLNENF